MILYRIDRSRADTRYSIDTPEGNGVGGLQRLRMETGGDHFSFAEFSMDHGRSIEEIAAGPADRPHGALVNAQRFAPSFAGLFPRFCDRTVGITDHIAAGLDSHHFPAFFGNIHGQQGQVAAGSRQIFIRHQAETFRPVQGAVESGADPHIRTAGGNEITHFFHAFGFHFFALQTAGSAGDHQQIKIFQPAIEDIFRIDQDEFQLR